MQLLSQGVARHECFGHVDPKESEGSLGDLNIALKMFCLEVWRLFKTVLLVALTKSSISFWTRSARTKQHFCGCRVLPPPKRLTALTVGSNQTYPKPPVLIPQRVRRREGGLQKPNGSSTSVSFSHRSLSKVMHRSLKDPNCRSMAERPTPRNVPL